MVTLSAFYAITKPDSLLRHRAKLSAFLISKKRPTLRMAESADSDNPADPIREYEDQTLSERLRLGLEVDRSGNSSMAYFQGMLWNSMVSGNYSQLLYDPVLFYRASRNRFRETRRRANAKLAGKTNIHKQVLDLWEVVMLDLLADGQPTAKDWGALTKKYDRQARRVRMDYYPHLVGNLGEGEMLYRVNGRDETRIPMKTDRNGPKDDRVQRVTTQYSLQSVLPGSFDLRVFADEAYLVRERAFWEGALEILNGWIGDGIRIRGDGAWLVPHMVNNDIAMHVIFDNLSAECESRWFKNLGDDARYEVAGSWKADASVLSGVKDEIESAMGEAISRFDDLEDHASGAGYVLRRNGQETFIPEEILSDKSIENIVFARIPMIAAACGIRAGSEFRTDRPPCPLTGEGARSAVDALKEFTADFEEMVPENLRQHVIGRDKMECRVRDIILKTIEALGTDSSADERSAAEAMTRRFHEQFRRPRPGPGSRPAAGGARGR